MDINTMIKIFGSMPVSELAAAQALSKSKSNINAVIMGILVGAVLGGIIGHKIAENRKIEKLTS